MIHRRSHRDLEKHRQPSLQPFSHAALLLVLLLPPSLSEPNNTHYLECREPTALPCGDSNFSIAFPFGAPGRAEYCSYPAFHLVCILDSMMMINIGSGGGFYQVKRIDYANRTLTVADPVFASRPCPQAFSDATLNFTLVGYTDVDVNLTVCINCTVNPMLYFLREITCLTGQLPSYYTFETAALSELSRSCGSVGIVPMSRIAARSMETGATGFGDALREGFEVTWSVGREWCGACVGSGGACGYDDGRPDDRICFCPNTNSTTGTCPSSAGRSEQRNVWKIALGVGVGGATLIAACFLCCFWFWRKKRRQSSATSNLLGQSASSDLSSIKDTEFGSINCHTHIFSYGELQEATNSFDASRELGDGGFGTVYKGKLRDGRIVAIKRLYENNCRRVEQFMNEVEILSRLRHPNLVNLYGCTSRHSRELLLVYEFVPNGTVADHLHGPQVDKGALSWHVRLRIAIETADALAYLHSAEHQIIHRDVKTNNILLDENFHVKVADFGLSRLFPIDVTHVSTLPQGTPGYVDPDYHMCYQLTDKSDVYSFGVVLVELISSKPAVDISRQRHEVNLAYMAISMIQNRQLEQLVDPGLGYCTDGETERMITLVAELAFMCLQGEKEMRPSIKEVLEELRRIQSGWCKAEKGAEADIQTREDAQLLKNTTPFSPDSVTGRWESRLTTPNTSE